MAINSQESPDSSFWNGKRVLVTGNTGFKGAWLCYWLHKLGADVYGVGLPPETNPNLYVALGTENFTKSEMLDIRDNKNLAINIRRTEPEIIFHLAAKTLVKESIRDPLTTIETNVIGTTNVLESIRDLDRCRVAVMVTTDKVYENKEWEWAYRENDELGGKDPYSASKAACELIIRSYRDIYFDKQGTSVSAARAGNVIGGGDWSMDRLIPDAIRAWRNHQDLIIRNPTSTRPWQHVLEPLRGYLKLAEDQWKNPKTIKEINFGPLNGQSRTVGDVVNFIEKTLHGIKVIVQQVKDDKEAKLLALDSTLAVKKLNLRPVFEAEESLERTINWYQQYYSGADAKDLCAADLKAFEKKYA